MSAQLLSIKCPVCDNNLHNFPKKSEQDQTFYDYECSLCGKYSVTERESSTFHVSPEDSHYLSAYLRQTTDLKGEKAIIDEN